MSGTDVYVGGGFTDAGGIANADYVARWDGTAWQALGASAGLGANSNVYALAVSGSDVYVGGGFINAGGNASADNIARWDGSIWQALGGGLNSSAFAIAVSGTDVYVGGFFTDAGGNQSADRIARWDGTAWQALGSGLNSSVNALALRGTSLYVGGSFSDAGGNPSADRIARWDGTAWQALGSGLGNAPVGGVVNPVYTITVRGTGVYVGGSFTDAGGIPNADNIARWDGTAWQALGGGLNRTVYALDVFDKSVYAGGDFTDTGDDALQVARFGIYTDPALVAAEANARTQTFSVRALPNAVEIKPGDVSYLRVEVFDVMGRRKAMLHEGAASKVLRLVLPADLATGMYLVRASSEIGSATAGVFVR